MKISDVKKKFKNRWVLVEVLKMNNLNQPTDVKTIVADRNRDKVYEAITRTPKDKLVATIFTGKIPSNFLL